jgi:hypothetical protein
MNPCYFNFEFELIQKKTAFKFEIEIWFDRWALAHLTQPTHLARLSQTGSGLGRSTDPAQPPSHSPLSSASSLAKPKLPPPSLGQSGHLQWPSPPMLGAKSPPQFPLPLTPIGIGGSFLSGEIWGGFPSISAAIDHLRFGCLAEPSLLCLLCHLWCLWCSSTRLWKRRGVVLPVCARWSHPRAASGRPRRHCPAMPSRRAPGRRWVWFLPPLTFFFFSGQLVKISVPSSQTLLCDAVSCC